MIKYISPRIEVYNVHLELSLAAGSAAVSPLGFEGEDIQESWEKEIGSNEFEW